MEDNTSEISKAEIDCDDCISRLAVLKLFATHDGKYLYKAIQDLPSVTPIKSKGQWERHYSRPGVFADLFWHCSNCGYKCREDYANIYYKYCPNCGSYNKEVTND